MSIKDQYRIIEFGEYGDENTELTLKSVVTLVNKLQPDGFDTFVNDFTEIKEGSGEGYEVYSGIPEDISANDVYDAAEGYSYITVIFDSAASGSGDEDGQNPVMNFIGPYSADRCTVTVAANGMEGAAVSVSWGQSASETVEYSMTGSFDVDTLEITYSDCEKKLVTYDENGDVVSEKVEFTDGAGVIRFNDDGTLTWQDENDAEMLEGMVFTFNG